LPVLPSECVLIIMSRSATRSCDGCTTSAKPGMCRIVERIKPARSTSPRPLWMEYTSSNTPSEATVMVVTMTVSPAARDFCFQGTKSIATFPVLRPVMLAIVFCISETIRLSTWGFALRSLNISPPNKALIFIDAGSVVVVAVVEVVVERVTEVLGVFVLPNAVVAAAGAEVVKVLEVLDLLVVLDVALVDVVVYVAEVIEAVVVVMVVPVVVFVAEVLEVLDVLEVLEMLVVLDVALVDVVVYVAEVVDVVVVLLDVALVDVVVAVRVRVVEVALVVVVAVVDVEVKVTEVVDVVLVHVVVVVEVGITTVTPVAEMFKTVPVACATPLAMAAVTEAMFPCKAFAFVANAPAGTTIE